MRPLHQVEPRAGIQYHLLIATLILVASATACSDDANTNTGTQSPRVVLYGHVTRNTGVGIDAASIYISHATGSCQSAPTENITATTDSNGFYRTVLSVQSNATGCVWLRVSAGGFGPDSIPLTNVPFGVPPTLDSVRTDFVLGIP